MRIAQAILNESYFFKLFDKLFRDSLFQNKAITLDDSKINILREHFCCENLEKCPEEIYNNTFIDFFLRYGLSNIIKNYYLISELHHLGLLSSAKKILDLGCGPGIFSFAYLMWCIDNSKSNYKNTEIVMVDGSDEFLTLFDTLWQSIEVKEKENFHIVPVSSLFDGNFPKEAMQPDLIIFSNSLLEVLRDSRVQRNKLVKNLIESNATIIIIDYLYDKTSALLRNITADLLPYYETISFYQWPNWNQYFQSVDLNHIEYQIDIDSKPQLKIASNINFLKTILIPKERISYLVPSTCSEIVVKYKAAWEQHDLHLLQKLFSSNALYQEKINQPPLIGIDNIRNYWIHNTKQQRRVEFLPLFISENNNAIRCLWKSQFYRKDLNHWLALTGEFIAEIRDNRIYSFRENFDKVVTNRKSSLNKLLHLEAIKA